MILYLWYLLGSFSVRAENDSHDGEKKSLLELVYPLDYRQALKLDFTDSAKVKRKNREWLKEVEKNEKMENFIIDMATINDTITVTPLTGLNMDGTSTPICFFAYDSSFEPIHEGMEFLNDPNNGFLMLTVNFQRFMNWRMLWLCIFTNESESCF